MLLSLSSNFSFLQFLETTIDISLSPTNPQTQHHKSLSERTSLSSYSYSAHLLPNASATQVLPPSAVLTLRRYSLKIFLQGSHDPQNIRNIFSALRNLRPFISVLAPNHNDLRNRCYPLPSAQYLLYTELPFRFTTADLVPQFQIIFLIQCINFNLSPLPPLQWTQNQAQPASFRYLILQSVS
ncbi:hypothetical protein B0O99DRAFT_326060 [Bisporella sp. PMI_857]|nr:hypothetical protein B0O99DRAFT_366957 [Bisporella sp. PMI_857]KAH8600441.1 hypothetical protein B0O99DRAFT_326060 [Bisporella sp. PMI_857]